MKKENIMNGQFNRGFTLIELMVTVAVAAILVAVAAPSFQAFFNRNRIATVTNDYIAAINYARSEAVKGGGNATLCMSNNNASCTGTGWSNGWIVTVGTALKRTHGPINAGNVAMGGTQTSFMFNGLGALTTAAGGLGMGDTFNICTPSDLTLSNSITVDPSGHLRRVANPALATCP